LLARCGRLLLVNRGAKRLAEMERDVVSELRATYPAVDFVTLAKERDKVNSGVSRTQLRNNIPLHLR
jgi:uncharacterized protein with HEPN domain